MNKEREAAIMTIFTWTMTLSLPHVSQSLQYNQKLMSHSNYILKFSHTSQQIPKQITADFKIRTFLKPITKVH